MVVLVVVVVVIVFVLFLFFLPLLFFVSCYSFSLLFDLFFLVGFFIYSNNKHTHTHTHIFRQSDKIRSESASLVSKIQKDQINAASLQRFSFVTTRRQKRKRKKEEEQEEEKLFYLPSFFPSAHFLYSSNTPPSSFSFPFYRISNCKP